jgi:hypothetical protein
MRHSQIVENYFLSPITIYKPNCCSFNGALSSSDYAASKDKMVTEKELERIWEEAVMADLFLSLSEGTDKKRETSNRIASRSWAEMSSRNLQTYEAGMLNTLRRSRNMTLCWGCVVILKLFADISVPR